MSNPLELTEKDIKAVFTHAATLMIENKDLLTELDGAIGDGDLGITMTAGFGKVSEELPSLAETDIGKIFTRAGFVMAQTVPSTMGTLVASGFLKAGKTLSGKAAVDLRGLSELFNSVLDGIMTRGKSKPGEKTIIDSLFPAALALKSAAEKGLTISEGLRLAREAATIGLEGTKTMKSVHGRAAYYGDQSIGRQDPGATVGMLIVRAFADQCETGEKE